MTVIWLELSPVQVSKVGWPGDALSIVIESEESSVPAVALAVGLKAVIVPVTV